MRTSREVGVGAPEEERDTQHPLAVPGDVPKGDDEDTQHREHVSDENLGRGARKRGWVV